GSSHHKPRRHRRAAQSVATIGLTMRTGAMGVHVKVRTGHPLPPGEGRRGAEELCERKRGAPAFAGGVEENSRWSSASGPDGVIAKNEAARTPPDRITAKDASRQGCRIRCDESRNAWHPCRGAVFVRAVSGGVRAVTFFATTPASREALDHRLSARTPPAYQRS